MVDQDVAISKPARCDGCHDIIHPKALMSVADGRKLCADCLDMERVRFSLTVTEGRVESYLDADTVQLWGRVLL